ncbi:unnamed protein product [Dovyalis caffra]|uniref:AAA+ ATPase domain-containing protein n=1 Tax=Dovyalis caffra TaxID=77055 RepID=A0AAV1R045_9ROSI|nr:unnamed protein product [Dovyalis caffra]
MYSLPSMPSTTSVLSTYTAFAASAMLVRSMLSEVQTLVNQFIPQKLQEKISSSLGRLFGNISSQLVLIVDEYNGLSINEIFQASEVYLNTRITPSVEQLKVSKDPGNKSISVTIDKGQQIIDTFEGIELAWQFVCTETQQTVVDFESWSQSSGKKEHRSILLSFHRNHKEKVLNTFLPYVLERFKAIKNEEKVLKLQSLASYEGVNLNHPSTFDTLAMDPGLKKEIMDDLDRFVRRKDFYLKVGKPWKRGYLLHGPPGTGKSSLIAAMANYLKFDIYDLELASLTSNSELRRLLASTTNRSILVIEDIDCSIELQDRQNRGYNQGESQQLTLSGLLNFIDGLWSSCGDERIIVFTTNYQDKLDPALLRPGRMDMHIHMSYCTPCGFKILASNYLNVKNHSLFSEIDELIVEVEVTPAEVAEELMKNEDVDIALTGLIGFLERKKGMKLKQLNVEEQKADDKQKENDNKNESQEKEEKWEKNKVKRNKRKKARRAKGRT